MFFDVLNFFNKTISMSKINIFISTNLKIKKTFAIILCILASIFALYANEIDENAKSVPSFITKSIASGPTLNADGSYDITFDFVIENISAVDLNNLQITDVLTPFAPANNIAFGTNTPNITLNSSFNGLTDANLLVGTDTFTPAETGSFQLILNVGPGNNFTTIDNEADLTGTAPDGTSVSESSIVTVNFPAPAPVVDIAKTISNGPTLNANGTYDITFDFTVKNTGDVNLGNIQVTDVLTAFATINNIAFGTNTPNISTNVAFDGSADTNLLLGTDLFAPAETGNFQLIINVGPDSNFSSISNQANISGTAPDGTVVNDISSIPVNFPPTIESIYIIKSVNGKPTLNTDATYDIVFDFFVQNTSNVILTNMQVSDALSSFTPINTINFGTSTPNISYNTAFDGLANTNILIGTDSLNPLETAQFQLIFNVGPDGSFSNILNTTNVNAAAPDGSAVNSNSAVSATFPSVVETIDLNKSVSSGPTLNDDGSYDITFDFFVENTGNVNLTDLQITDALGAFAPVNNVSFGSNTPNITINANFDGITSTNLLVGNDGLAPSEIGSFKLIINVGPNNNFATIANNAEATATSPEGNIVDNTAIVNAQFSTIVSDFNVSKTLFEAPVLNIDGTYDYSFRIEVTNTGNVNLSNLEVFDNLTQFAPINSANVFNFSSNVTPNGNFDGVLDVNLLQSANVLAPAENAVFYLSVNSGPYNPVQNIIPNTIDAEILTLFGNTLTNQSATDAFFATPNPNINIVKTLVNIPSPNDDGTFDLFFKIDIENTGNITLNNIQVTDDFNVINNVNSAAISNASANISPNGTFDGILDINALQGIDNLKPNESGSFIIEVNVGPYTGQQFFTNIAEVAAFTNANQQIVDNDDEIITINEPTASLAIDKLTLSGPSINNDGTYDIVYRIELTNTGEVTLTDIQVTDNLNSLAPINQTFVTSASANISPNSNYNGINNNNTLTGFDFLLPGEVGKFDVTLNVGPYVTLPTNINNIANVNSFSPNGTSINNTDSEPINLQLTSSSLSINKTVLSAPTLNIDGTYDATYLIEITNTGNVNLNNVQIEDDLNALSPLNSVSITNTSGSLSSNGSYNGITDVNTLLGNDVLAPNETGRLNVNVNFGPTPIAVNTIQNTALANAENPNGTQVSENAVINTQLPLAVSKLNTKKELIGQPTLNVDGTYTIEFKISIENTGNVILTDIQLADDLSAYIPINTVTTNTASANISLNANFDGINDLNMLQGFDNLLPNESGNFTMLINVGPYAQTPAAGTLSNSINASAIDPLNEVINSVDTEVTDLPTPNTGLVVTKTFNGTNTANSDGTYDLDFFIELDNNGNVTLNDVQLIDDLSNFSPINFVTINNPSPNINVNPLYDGLTNSALLGGNDQLDNGQKASLEITVNVGPYDSTINTNSFNNTASASAFDPTGNTINSSNNISTPLNPVVSSISINKNLTTPPRLKADGSYDIKYSFEIKNTGSVSLDAIQIIDDLNAFSPVNNIAISNTSANISPNASYNGISDLAVLLGIDSFAPNELGSFEITINVGPYSSTPSNFILNKGTVFGTNPSNETVNSTDAVETFFSALQASLNVEKTLLNTPMLNADGTIDLEFNIRLTNIGNVDLSSIQVVDELNIFTPVNGVSVVNTSSNVSPNSSYNGVSNFNTLLGNDNLAPGETAIFDIVTNVGPYSFTPTNIANQIEVTAQDPAGNEVAEIADEPVVLPEQEPAISITKNNVGTPVLNNDGSFDIIYSIDISNNGNANLSNIQIFDDLSNFSPINTVNLSNTSANLSSNANYNGINDQSILIANSTLVPGETASVQLNLNVGPFATNIVSITNSGIVNGTDPGATIISDTSNVNTILPAVNPTVVINKSILDGPTLQSNGTYETVYLIEVTNSGNTDLTNLQISDNLNILAPLNNVGISNVSANFNNNIGYNGLTDINLLTGTDNLSSNEIGFLQITINSGPYGNNLYNTENIATVSAKDPAGNNLQENDSAITSYEPPNPLLGLSKALISSPALLPNGTFNILLRFFVENSGNVSIKNLQITDDLSNTFSIAPTPNINAVNLLNTSNNISGNTNYNGVSDINLLLGSDQISPGENGFVDLEVNFGPLPQNTNTTFYNTAVALGFDPSFISVTDSSTNGLDPDPENNGPADNLEPTPISTTPPIGQIGIAKELVSSSSILANGTYNIVYKIKVENTGPVIANNVQIIDNLSAAFAGPPMAPINNVLLTGATNNITINPDFNGTSDNNLLIGSDSLASGESATIRIETNVGIVPQPGGTYLNQAFVSAVDSDGSTISDGSQNGNDVDPDGDGPLNNNEPTPLTLDPGFSDLTIVKTIKTAPVLNQNGTYDLSFNITVENSGFVPLDNLQILDALTDFSPINSITLANSSSNLSPNSAYDGLFNVNLLTGNNTLLVGEAGSLDIFLNVGPFSNNINQLTNFAIATAFDENDTQIFKDDNVVTNFGALSTDLDINKFVVAGPTDNEDGTYDITFRITVTNNGNVSLANLQISDDLIDYAPVNSINFQNLSSNLSPNGSYDGINNTFLLNGTGILAPSESGSIDLDINVGPFSTSKPNLKNVATVTANLPNEQAAAASDFINTPIDFIAPEIDVTKTLVTAPILNIDGTYNFNFLIQVSNTGLIQLNDLQIADDLNNFGPINSLNVSNASSNLTLNLAYDGLTNTNILSGIDVLQSNEGGTFNIELNTGPFANNPDSLLNTVIAIANSSNNIDVEDIDTALVNLETYQSNLLVQKRLFGGPVVNNDGTYSIKYLLSVENKGNTQINNIQLVDDLTNFAPIVSTAVTLPSFTLFANSNYNGTTDSNLLLPNNSLAPGEIGIINLDIVVGPYSSLPENLENLVVASGLDPINTMLTSEATAPTPFNISDPELAISKTLIDGPDLQNDGSYTFSYLINLGNIGPVEISNLQLQDDLAPFAPVNSAVLSSPTANLSLNPSYDGLFNINTLAGIDILGSSQIGAFKLTVNAGPFNNNNNTIVNTAIVSGLDPTNKNLYKSTQEPATFEFFEAAITVDKLLLKPPTLNTDGTYDQLFFINLANTGAVVVNGLQLLENLTQYAPLNEVTIISPSANLSPNVIFDGINSKNLLTGLDVLLPGEQASVAIAINSGPYNPPPNSITNIIIANAKDPLGNVLEDVATEESIFNAEAPKILINKSLASAPIQLTNGTYELLFNIDVKNIGNVEVGNLQLIDELSIYQTLNNVEIVNATPNLSQNFAYDGLSNNNMLFGFDRLIPDELAKLQLLINVGPYDTIPQNLKNEVNVFALSPNKTTVTERAVVETPITSTNSEILLAKRLNELPRLQSDGSYNLTYSFVLQNTGNTLLNEVQVTDDLLNFEPINNAQVLFTSANISPNSNYNGISDINLLSGLNDLQPGQLATFNLQLNIGPYANNIDTLFNSASILAKTPSGKTVEDKSGYNLGTAKDENLPTPTPFIIPKPALSITKNLVANPTINSDGSFTAIYVCEVKNTGNIVLNNLQLQDDLSAFNPVNNVTISDFSTNLTINNSFNGLANINLLSGNNTLQTNETARLEITINVGAYPNTVIIDNQIFGEATTPQNVLVQDASDGVFSNDTFDDPTSANFIKVTEVDLSINKQTITPVIAANEVGKFLITVTNNSAFNTAHNIVINEILPIDLNYAGHLTSLGIYNQFNMQWQIDSLLPQASAKLTLQVESDVLGTFTNNCVITSVDEKETNSFNNESNANITIMQPAIDLKITKFVFEDVVNIGEAALFEIVIENLSDELATGIIIEENLPAGSYINSENASSGIYDISTNRWYIDSIAPQSKDTLSLSLTSINSGSFKNTVIIIQSDQPDQFSANNTSSANFSVAEAAADLSIKKTALNNVVLQNGIVDFSIVLTNNSNVEAENVIVEEILPNSFDYHSHVVSFGSYNSLSNLWFVHSIRPGKSETLTLSTIANETGSFTNTVNILESEPTDSVGFNNTSSATVTVTEIPPLGIDLSITKTAQKASIYLGETVAFNIELINYSDKAATNVIVEELMPSSFTYLSHQLSDGSYYALSNLWEVKSLAAKDTVTLTLNVLPNKIGNYTNFVNIAESLPADTTLQNNSHSANITVQQVVSPSIDLSINKTVQKDTIDLGETVAFDIEITNNSNVAATNVFIEELMPASFTYLDHQLSNGAFYALTNIWEIDSLAPLAIATLTLNVLPNQIGTFLNSVYIAETQPADTITNNNSSNASITIEEVMIVTPVEPTVDLSINKTVQKDTIDLGETAAFDIEITNNSNAAAKNVLVKELLPASFTYMDHIISSGDFNTTSNIWEIETIAPATTEILTLYVKPNQIGTFLNSVIITESETVDNIIANNTSGAAVTVKKTVEEVDLRISNSVNKQIIDIGDTVTLSINVSNISNNKASNVTIEELLPEGLNYMGHTAAKGTFNTVNKLWAIPSLQAQTSATLAIEVQANSLGTLVNVANIIDAAQTDINLFNNSASASVFVNERTLFADLAVTISANKPIADIDEMVEFNLILSNYGPNDATNIVVKEMLPNTVNYLSYNATYGLYNIANGQWLIDNLPSNTSIALSIQTNTSISGVHTNTAKIIFNDALDSNLTNNSDSATFTVLTTNTDACFSPAVCATINECIEPGAELLICPQFCATGNFTITKHSILLAENSVAVLGNCITYVASTASNNTTDILRIEAKNQNGVCLNFKANIEIKNCNEINIAPVITDRAIELCGAPVRATTICVEASDQNNDVLSICEISTLFDASIGNAQELCFTYKPLPSSNGVDEVTVTVCDNGSPSLSTTSTYYVNVACEKPILNNDYLQVTYNEATFNNAPLKYNNHTVLVNPFLNDAVSTNCYNKLEIKTVSTIANATGEVMLVDGQIQFKPNTSFTGNDVINYSACNNCGKCETGNIYIESEMQNCELFSEICSPAFVATEICVEFCSSDVGIKNISSLYNATTTVVNETCFTYHAIGLNAITDTLKVIGKNLSGNTETVHLLNYINDGCLIPSAIDDVLHTDEHKEIWFDVVENDDPITNRYELKIIKPTLNGDCIKNLDGSILYKPAYGFTGLDILTYELCNAHYNCDTATVYLNIESDNVINLIAFNDYYTTNQNEAITIDVLANDTLTLNINKQLTITSKPLFGAASFISDDIKYMPNEKFVGIDFFEYEICNEFNECDKAIVQINVLATFITSTEEFIIPETFEITQLLNGGNTISLQINATESKTVSYYLFDVMGKSLQSGSLNLNIGNNIISLEKPAANTQVLLFSLKSDAHFISKKVYVH